MFSLNEKDRLNHNKGRQNKPKELNSVQNNPPNNEGYWVNVLKLDLSLKRYDTLFSYVTFMTDSDCIVVLLKTQTS